MKNEKGKNQGPQKLNEDDLEQVRGGVSGPPWRPRARKTPKKDRTLEKTWR